VAAFVLFYHFSHTIQKTLFIWKHFQNREGIRTGYQKRRALGDGLSDIGRFSLPEPNFEGIRQSRTRGLFEHGMINRAGLRIAEDNMVKKKINVRSSAGPRSLVREWREKSDWSENIPQCSLL
jgi:hypothetical protein